MAYQIPYTEDTYRIQDALIPGNSTAQIPVEFDLVPAEGEDLVRIKSAVVGTAGLTLDVNWTDTAQGVVLASFKNAPPAFIRTVLAIRGLFVPAALAQRVGIISEIPMAQKSPDQPPMPDRSAPVAILTGEQFAKVANHGMMIPVALAVAFKIAEITGKIGALDSRFFAQPSGSGGPGTASPTSTTVASARKGTRRRATVAKPPEPSKGD